MTTPPAEIIKELLVDLGVAEESDGSWPAYVSFLPENPDKAIAVYDVAGTPDGRIMTTGVRIEHHGIQIRVRSLDYPTGYRKAMEIALSLDNQLRVLVAIESDQSYVVQNISRTGTMIALGVDENDGRRRHYFTVNAVATIPDVDEATAINIGIAPASGATFVIEE